MNKSKVIYSINIKDIYAVAEESLERKPTKEEIKFVEEKIGDHIQWHDTIENLLNDYSASKKADR